MSRGRIERRAAVPGGVDGRGGGVGPIARLQVSLHTGHRRRDVHRTNAATNSPGGRFTIAQVSSCPGPPMSNGYSWPDG